MIRDIVSFLFKRTSIHAFCVIIWVSQYLSKKDLRGCIEYLEGMEDI